MTAWWGVFNGWLVNLPAPVSFLVIFVIVSVPTGLAHIWLRNRTSKGRNGESEEPEPKEQLEAWQILGARTKWFKLYEAACLLVGDDPVWPLKTKRSIEEYNELCECIRTEKLDDPKCPQGDTLSFQFGHQTKENLEGDRGTIRQYLYLQNRNIPAFLLEKHDKASL